MNAPLRPIAANLWTDEGGAPRLLGGKDANGKFFFPIPEGDAGLDLEVVQLSRTGTLWSFTRQDFRPKPPYDGPEAFTPFLLGYVELPGQVIVETHIVQTKLEQLYLGMEMEMVITEFDETRTTFAFRPTHLEKDKR